MIDSVQRGDLQLVAFKPSLDRPVAQAFIHRFGSHVVTIDCQKLGFDPAAEDARPRIAIRSRHGTAAAK